jgi:hypothetical protein
MTNTDRASVVLLAVSMTAACDGLESYSGEDALADTRDVASDTGLDVLPDTTLDPPPDTTLDPPPDTGLDVPPDTTLDPPPDTGLDVPPDGEATVEPYMLIIMDTSGSMAWDVDGVATNGDGSMDPWGSRWCCPGDDRDGDTIANDSRMYIAKEAMRQVVADTDDVTFGLMKFPQNFDDGSGLSAAHYYDNQTSGEYDDLRYNGDGVCESDVIDEYLVAPFADESSSDVLTWMNHTEYSGAGIVKPGEYELRAVGTTPLAWTIDQARHYFVGIDPFTGHWGVIPNDAKSECRPYYAIIFTDGDEACSSFPADEVRDLYDNATGHPVRSYVIGLAHDSSTLNQMADYGDDGTDNDSTTAYRADSEDELSAILFDIIAELVFDAVC